MVNKSNFELINGVYVSKHAQQKFADFEKAYLTLRTAEHRVLSLEEIRALPETKTNSTDHHLWEIRKKNIFRFLKHLSKKKKSLRILDIGCGNGFFSNLMSKDHTVCAVDVNLTELKQAAEAFQNNNIHWYYADIMNEYLPEDKFDLITFCASFQYFENGASVLKQCKNLLNENGEIHIIDSPFYTAATKAAARERSIKHFSELKTEQMKNYYQHNTYDVLRDFKYQFGYKPRPWFLYLRKDSPFPWIILRT